MADGSGNTYVYDAWNQLVTVKNNGTTVASYTYDGLGRRVQVTEGGTTTDLYYSGDQVIEEDVGGKVQAQNVWSPVYVNALVLRDQSSQHNGVLDQRLYVQQDADWNVTALVDISGNVVERYDYLPYGSVTVLNPSWTPISASAYNVPYDFQGMRSDALVSLNFADNRVYDPALSRWLQTDPLGLNAGNNDYEAFGDQPTDMVDPGGLQNTKEEVDKILDRAQEILKKKGIPLDKREVRYNIIRYVLSAQFTFERSGDEDRGPYWDKRKKSPRTNGIIGLYFGPNSMFSEGRTVACNAGSANLIIKAVIAHALRKNGITQLNGVRYWVAPGVPLQDELFKAIYKDVRDYYNGESDDDDNAFFYTERNEKGFREEDLLPGDQIWFDNPYYQAGKGYTGESGSNVFYLGDGYVAALYPDGSGRHEILKIKDYQKKMMVWGSVTANAGKPGFPILEPGVFRIKARARPKIYSR